MLRSLIRRLAGLETLDTTLRQLRNDLLHMAKVVTEHEAAAVARDALLQQVVDENANLTSRVLTLESQVAELRNPEV